MSRLAVIKAVFEAYFKAELIREHGAVLSILSLSLWLTMFLTPLWLFAPKSVNASLFGSFAFVGILIFVSYTMASWDWGWQLRWLLYQGILEYVMVSGRDILILYAGIIPVSLIWLSFVGLVAYAIITMLIGPPLLMVHDVLLLCIGIATLILVLLSYALILGGTTIAVGTSGPIVEFISWILPIATGGLTPLQNLPELLRIFALCTPFSYPAELIRYALGLSSTVMDVQLECFIGVLYAILFFIAGFTYFKLQLKKILREGIKSVAMY